MSSRARRMADLLDSTGDVKLENLGYKYNNTTGDYDEDEESEGYEKKRKAKKKSRKKAKRNKDKVYVGNSMELDVDEDLNFILDLTKPSTTISMDNLDEAIGSSGTIVLQQDSSGGRNFSLATYFKTPLGGASIVQYTAPNSVSTLNYIILSETEVLVNYIGNFA
jgi:hypothetical protein